MTVKPTQLVHLGRASADAANAINPPLVRASTTTFPTLGEFKNSYKGVTFETPRYGRTGTSTVFELQMAMATLCATESCIATASGLSAIAAVIGAHAGPGKRILIQDCVYGPTRVLAEKELRKLGSEAVFFDTLNALETHIDERTALVFVEVPGSLTMDMIDVGAVCKLAKRHDVPVACDSSWGTSLFFDAHNFGVNISIHAATKYIGGHSDIILGLLTGSYEDLASTREWCAHFGSTAAPDVCWLGLRGLRTLDVRMRRHEENARHVALVLFPPKEQSARDLIAGLSSVWLLFSKAAMSSLTRLGPSLEADRGPSSASLGFPRHPALLALGSEDLMLPP
ncbi:trans-sulfuration enzyme family protein [Brucella pituitosa]|uniref:trans-sulfuration enzyme family protein n=1 Tax=Brucella pituitosa TaxID=571256 RepID=UPI003C717558